MSAFRLFPAALLGLMIQIGALDALADPADPSSRTEPLSPDATNRLPMKDFGPSGATQQSQPPGPHLPLFEATCKVDRGGTCRVQFDQPVGPGRRCDCAGLLGVTR